MSGRPGGLAMPCATSTRKPSTPRSSQNRRMRSNSAGTAGLVQFRSGCSGANRCRYHCPSGTRCQAGPPNCDGQLFGGSSPFGAAPVPEDEQVALGAAGPGGQRRLEPRVPVGEVVRHDVDRDPHAVRVRRLDQVVEVGQRAERSGRRRTGRRRRSRRRPSASGRTARATARRRRARTGRAGRSRSPIRSPTPSPLPSRKLRG